ncbi:MAG: AAA family ATPase [Firmicutes bacterium]|nr:AAA family ATPase [Bacillota bacterium]
MKLMAIQVENFRCFAQESFRFHDGENLLLAHNAQGKSSTFEAIVWCLFGTDGAGKKNADTRLLRHGTKTMRVETSWQTESGQTLTFLRIKPEQGAVQLLMNGNKAKPGAVERWFGDVSTFLSIFAPGYFSGLEPKEAKAVLARVGQVDVATVLMYLDDADRDYLSTLTLGMGMDSADVLLKQLRQEQREREAELLRLEGSLNAWKAELSASKPEPYVPSLDAAKLAMVEATKKDMVRLEMLLEKVPQERLECEKRLNEARARYVEMKQGIVPDIEDRCPTCHQVLPKEQQAIAHNKRLAKNGKIQVLLREIQQEGERLKRQLEQMSSPDYTRAWQEKLASHRASLASYADLAQQEQAAMVEYQAKKIRWEHAKQSYDTARTDHARCTAQLEHVTSRIEVLKRFQWRYVQVQNRQLNAPLVHAKLELFRVSEDGEIKEAFGVTWQDKPYRTLSTSERVRCDLEISRLLMALAVPEVLPVFIDNAESVERLYEETFAGQAIAARVADCDLTVTQPSSSVLSKGA